MTRAGRPGADSLVERFVDACERGRLEEVRSLCQDGQDVDAVDRKGKTGLMYAASRNHLEIMRCLLDHGADPDKANRNGTTPLMFAKTAAFASGDCRGMKLLVDAGANPRAVDNHGLTALDYTIRRAELVAGFLQDHGARA